MGSLLVVDDVVSAQLLQNLRLLGRTGSSDDFGTSSLGELNGEEADTTSTLSKDPLARNKLLALKTVKSVPRSKTSASESSALEEVEALGEGDETLLVESTVGAESTVENTTEAGVEAVDIDGAADVLLVEEGDDLVAGLEASDVLANSEDGAGAI